MTKFQLLKAHVCIAGVAVLSAASPALAQFEALMSCQRTTEAAARLACYDREVPRLTTQAPLATLPVVGPSRPAPAGTTAPAAAAAEARFGLKTAPDAEPPARIVSALPDGFEGWQPRQRIRLANGQVWQIADDSTAFVRLKSPTAVVRQGALGAFYLEFDGDNRSPRVRRVE